MGQFQHALEVRFYHIVCWLANVLLMYDVRISVSKTSSENTPFVGVTLASMFKEGMLQTSPLQDQSGRIKTLQAINCYGKHSFRKQLACSSEQFSPC